MTLTRVVALTALLFGASPAFAQAVKLEFHDGLVTVTAQNAPLRTILTEWSRLGGTQVINADRLSGAPVTLQLTNVPETQALDVVLRGVAGYIAGQRPASPSTASRSSLDRIMIVPTAGTATVAGARPIATPAPFTAPRQIQQPTDPDDDPISDVPPEDERPVRVPGLQLPRGVNQAPPQPFQPQDDDNDTQSQRPGNNQPVPANPFGIQTGSSRPGTISPVPQQPPPQQRPRPDPEP
jgi:hypothetical protein